jgi:hypothetical protein
MLIVYSHQRLILHDEDPLDHTLTPPEQHRLPLASATTA